VPLRIVNPQPRGGRIEKCVDAEMNPAHEDVSLEGIDDGIHTNCGNIVLL